MKLVAAIDVEYAQPMRLLGTILLLIVQLLQYWKKDSYIIFRLPTPARAVVYASFFLAFLVFGEFGGKPFIYFQF